MTVFARNMYYWRQMSPDERNRVLALRKAQKRPWHSPPHKETLKRLGRLHGRLSHRWNGEEKSRGRQVWCKIVERHIRSDAHFHACINYIHHNPIKHGLSNTWTEWPFSGAQAYLDAVARKEAIRRWRTYDVSKMGKEWDP